MTFVSLQQEHLTGITAIDAQHGEMVARLNRLYELNADGHDHEMLLVTFRDLINITRNHFTYEERMLEQHGYSELDTHRAEHAELLRQVEGLESQLQKGSLVFSSHVMALLRDWLFIHILEEDGAYLSHLLPASNSAA